MANAKPKTHKVTTLMSEEHLEKVEKQFIAEAAELSLLSDYTFITSFRNYKKQLEVMQMLLETIEEKKDAGEDIDKEVGRYNQSGGQADKFLTKIRAIIADKKKEIPPPESVAELAG